MNTTSPTNNKILYWSITVALAGFLFGFDTIVINGAEQQIQELWKGFGMSHGLVVSMALWGTVIGALFGSIPTDRFGRKNTLIWIGILYTISALGSALVSDPYSFSFFRFMGGLGVGASTIAAPAYVSEIAPAHRRGSLVAMYQFNIVFGILIAYASNFALSGLGENAWRWMMGVEAIPAIIYTVMVLGVPNSPRWLVVRKNDVERAREILLQLNTEAEAESILTSIQEKGNTVTKNQGLFDPKYRYAFLLAFLFAFFNQVSGINAFLYFSKRIFEVAGLGSEAAFLGGIGIGIVNLIFTMLGLYLIDRVGRKLLMYIGSVGYIFSLTMVAMAFFYDWQGIAVPAFLFLFIASHAIGQGAVIWVFISEIFPNHLRATGQSLGSSTHWVAAALITLFMPQVLEAAQAGGYVGYIFLAFAGMMVLQLLFVIFMMPETKGTSLEEV
ncbi:MAG: sugar porter family MFS transporter [Bacteroidota bacterium]